MQGSIARSSFKVATMNAIVGLSVLTSVRSPSLRQRLPARAASRSAHRYHVVRHTWQGAAEPGGRWSVGGLGGVPTQPESATAVAQEAMRRTSIAVFGRAPVTKKPRGP